MRQDQITVRQVNPAFSYFASIKIQELNARNDTN